MLFLTKGYIGNPEFVFHGLASLISVTAHLDTDSGVHSSFRVVAPSLYRPLRLSLELI